MFRQCEWKRYGPISMLLFVLSSSLLNCSNGDKNSSSSALILALIQNNSNNQGYTLDSGTGCITGVTSSMSSGLPDWIKNNFKCAVGTVSGGNYVFTSRNLPNTKSYYYGSGQPLYDDLPSGNSALSSYKIKEQNFTYTIPGTPAVNGGTKTTTSGLIAVGMTINGLAIFNNTSDAGGTMADHKNTFDKFNGHPSASGVYHHHADPKNLTNDDAALVGIALDGYPIYGAKCDRATSDTGDDAAPGFDSGTPALDAYHGHTANTVLFPSGTYHYHYTFDVIESSSTLIGAAFNGNVGSVTN